MRIHGVLSGVLAIQCLMIATAQEPKHQAPSALSDPAMRRNIEVEIRNTYRLPQNVTITLGDPHASRVEDFYALPVTVSSGTNTSTLEFLISKDGNTLAKLDTFNLVHNSVRSLDLAGRPIRGNPQARVTILTFDDLECPVCARMHQAFFPATLNRYKDKVRFIYKDNPLTQIHPWAMHAAVNANCLAKESTDAYWKYVDYLHAHADDITGHDDNQKRRMADLDRIARDTATGLNLNTAQVESCLSKQDESAVRISLGEAAILGLNYAPAVFVDGERIEGYIPPPLLWTVIDRALRAAGVDPPEPVEQQPTVP